MKKLFTIKKKKEFRELAAFLVLFYILPIYLLVMGVIPFELRHVVLFLMSLIMVAWAMQKPLKTRELGFRKDNLKPAIVANLLTSAALVALIFIGKATGLLHSVDYGGTMIWLVVYIIISVPLQEFIFRSLVFREVGVFTDNGFVKVIISTLLFAFAHAMYQNPQILLITGVAGLVWGVTYLKYPNFWGVTLSHAIVGLVAISVGLV